PHDHSIPVFPVRNLWSTDGTQGTSDLQQQLDETETARRADDGGRAARNRLQGGDRTIGSHAMSATFPVVYLVRHGETAWTVTGQHTGLTDLPLTARGEEMAQQLGERLEGRTFAKVFTSPLRRAVRTCELAGFGTEAELDPDLVEWDYGQYEGR